MNGNLSIVETKEILTLVGAMNLTLSLSPEEIAELQRRAAAAGTDVRTFLMHVATDTDDTGDFSVSDVPYEVWKHDFRSWVTRHQSRNVNVDDSRESIYD